MVEQIPELFLKALENLTAWLESKRTPSMIVGGVAASILGRPRATRDIDVLAIIAEESWAQALLDAEQFGFAARIDNALEFARRTRVLLLRHVESVVDIDIILGRLAFEEQAIARSQWHQLGGVRVRLPMVEDLLIMKAIAQRPQDQRDIEGLLDVHQGADVEVVRQWIREFSIAMTMPDLLDGFEKLLSERKSKSDG